MGAPLSARSPGALARFLLLSGEGGRAAIESYTELKTVLLPLTDEMI